MSPKTQGGAYFTRMDFTIVTPSFNQLDLLARCISSVADQEEVTLEHVIQDAGTKGFGEFTEIMRSRWPDRPGYRRTMVSEPDQGMYDAINKGLRRGTGEICAYLNCDEQYLPGTLKAVREKFTQTPEAEILYGGFLVVDSDGKLVAFRRPVKMSWPHVATSHLPNFTCSTFFRRALLERDQAWFDPNFKACGDAVWTIARLQSRIPSRNHDEFLAIFTEGKKNQGVSGGGLAEAQAIRKSAPLWARIGSPLWKTIHRTRKIFAGGYRCEPIQYQLFLGEQKSGRTAFYVARPNPIWKSRLFLKRGSRA
jgi:glycosyltransferase involved in cell wall biosynthesis